MRNKVNSINYSILREITSASRTSHLSYDSQYMIIYAFIYKYCSDSLKDHFQQLIQNKEVTLDEAYKISLVKDEFRQDAYNMYGYFIKSPDAFFDEVMVNHFNTNDFFRQFAKGFSENVEFGENHGNEKYFKYIFDAVNEDFNFEAYEMENENAQILKDIIRLISKLDIFDGNFHFSDVFNALSDSRVINANSNPDYVYQILSAILVSQKGDLNNVYDPFMGDGTSFLSLSNIIGLWKSNNYGKESDKVTYLYTIAKLFLNYYDLDSLFVELEDSTHSADFNQTPFDAILSVIPIKIRNYHTSNKNQSLEIAKRHKRAELENLLTSNFDIDLNAFSQDAEINKALEKLINKMDVESETSSQFEGEYETLADSEFLFLINLINSLKSDGLMAISISQNFLFKESLKTLRKYLTFEKNYIDSIISIPNEFGRYKRPEVIIVFRKDKNDHDVLFIDMSRKFETTRPSLVVPGRFRSNLLLSDTTIDEMVDALVNRRNVEKYSQLVGIDEILSNGFNLSVSKYVDTFEGEFITLRQLEDDKQKIDKRHRELSDKIDMMMRDLNIKSNL